MQGRQIIIEKCKIINPTLIDTHAHLIELRKKDAALFADIAPELKTAMKFLLDVGLKTTDTAERIALLQTYELPYFSLGLYPSQAQSAQLDHELLELNNQLSQYQNQVGPKLIALGEIGIDYFRDYGPLQPSLFKDQIQLANRFGLPIVVHNRQADSAILESFRQAAPEYGGVMHCYSSDITWLPKFLDFGLYISFAGNATYKNANAIQESIRGCPVDRILCETDSPYLSPKPYQSLTNTPLRVGQTMELIASIKQLSVAQLSQKIMTNTQRCFRLAN